MSKKIALRETPLSHPRLFDKIRYRDVRVGDIFQGKKNRKKWYRNTDVSQKDSKYTYWRRKSGLSKAKARPVSKKPVKSAAKKAVKPTAAKKVVTVSKADVVKIVRAEVSKSLKPKLEAVVRSFIKKLLTTKIS